MTEILKKYIEPAIALRTHYPTLIGLLLGVLLFGFLGHKIFVTFSEILSPVLGRWGISEGSLPYMDLAFTAILPLAHCGVWFSRRRIPRVPKGKVGMLFAVHSDEAHTAYVLQLYDSVRALLANSDPANKLHVDRVPVHIRVVDRNRAEILLGRAAASLVVWGEFKRAKKNGKNTLGFSGIHFTFNIETTKPPSPQYIHDASVPIAGAEWTFDEENEFVGTDLLARNILHVASNLIGMGFLVANEFASAVAVFGPLHTELSARTTAKRVPDYLQRFANLVRRNLAHALVWQVRKQYQAALQGAGLPSILPPHLSEWMSSLDEAIRLQRDIGDAYIMKAICLFLTKDLQKSADALAIAESLFALKRRNHDQAACQLSRAFLLLYSGNFRKAIRKYKDVLHEHTDLPHQLVTQILAFISQILELEQDKGQLHYALALLNKEYFDCKAAAADFSAFIAFARTDPYYRKFVPDAEKELSNLSEDATREGPEKRDMRCPTRSRSKKR